jgi:hypothetical protein
LGILAAQRELNLKTLPPSNCQLYYNVCLVIDSAACESLPFNSMPYSCIFAGMSRYFAYPAPAAKKRSSYQ